MLGTPPAFVLSQDQTLELNPDHQKIISDSRRSFTYSGLKTLVFSLAGPSNLLDRFLNYLLIFFDLALYSFQGAFPAVLPVSLVRFPSALDYNTKYSLPCQRFFAKNLESFLPTSNFVRHSGLFLCKINCGAKRFRLAPYGILSILSLINAKLFNNLPSSA